MHHREPLLRPIVDPLNFRNFENLMRSKAWRRLGAILVALFPLSGFSQGGDWGSLQRRIIEIYDETRDAIVRVKAAYEARGEEMVPQVVVGTGFFISNNGLVLTNAGIVGNPVRVWVEHHDIAYSAELIGRDHDSNVALLRLDTVPNDFEFIHLMDSSELPPIGQLLIRMSAPFEFSPTPQLGMVAGFESRFGSKFFPCRYIRASMQAAPGSEGAAYVDLAGRLVGIQVHSLPELGSTYVLPARAAMRIRDDLLFSGEVTYGWIGFEVRDESSVRDGRRQTIAKVLPDTPAAEVGLVPGDVLLRIGEHPIHTVDDIRSAMFYTRVGQFVEVDVRRDGNPMEFSVKLVRRPDDEPLQVIRPIDQPKEPLSPMESSGNEAEENADPVEEFTKFPH